ncbi:Uncharacterised protein [Burkholderia pseudomallei]|nr:Uncharacterised protein [Burkholderia pseudomallei]VBL69160.1 Uncharacterised protein [Burkholderia pseudomallei]
MKEQSDMAASQPTSDGKMAVNAGAWRRATAEARVLRAMFDKLSPIERALASAQIEAVRRLVDAVEAL